MVLRSQIVEIGNFHMMLIVSREITFLTYIPSSSLLSCLANRLGKLLEGVKVPRGFRGQNPSVVVRGEAPWSWRLFSAEIVIGALSEHVFSC